MTTSMETLEFDLPAALLIQLVELLDQMPSERLLSKNLTKVPEEQGIYQLFLDEKLVYIGKTDSEAGLKKRLARHCEKSQNRKNLSPGLVKFKAVRIYVFTAMDLESQLISHYKGTYRELEWQNSGFGANDPGRERDSGKPGTFDSQYPVDIDIPFAVPPPMGTIFVSDALANLKRAVPYVIRFERLSKGRAPHNDLADTSVTIDKSLDTPKKILQEIKRVLGDEWQITILPGYVIIYKERKVYSCGIVL